MVVQIGDQWQQAVNLSAQDTTGRGRYGGKLDPSKDAHYCYEGSTLRLPNLSFPRGAGNLIFT